jgi:hypothetical protein
MKLTDKLPRPLAWFVRILFWGLSLLVIWSIFNVYANMKLVNLVGDCMENLPRTQGKVPQTSLEASKDMVACMDQRGGFPEKLKYSAAKKTVQMLPSIPCRYVGVWTATRSSTVYQVTLRDDSQFTAAPIKDTTPGAQTVSGSWGARDGKMVWLYDTGRFWPPDVNPITDINNASFTLREADGSTTRYDLVEHVQSSSCTPD